MLTLNLQTQYQNGVNNMRFVSRVSFRRLGCDFAQVCEITGACVILRSHEITHPGVKSQPPAKSYPGV